MPDLHEQGGLLYKWLFYSYRALGNNDKASFFAEKLIVAQQEENENQQSVAEVKGEYEKQIEINKVQAEQQIRRYKLYLWIALLLAVLLAVVVLVFRYRKAKELEVLRSREAQQKLQLELDHAAQQSMQLLQQRALAIYQSDQDYKLKRILDAFDSAYPQAVDNLKKDHPDLSETERQLALLNLLRFRSKEEADLLGLSENTVRKYRSNLRKKLDSDAFSTLGG
jgi:DNA-binding CsgD family transcriptional regulator